MGIQEDNAGMSDTFVVGQDVEVKIGAGWFRGVVTDVTRESVTVLEASPPGGGAASARRAPGYAGAWSKVRLTDGRCPDVRAVTVPGPTVRTEPLDAVGLGHLRSVGVQGPTVPTGSGAPSGATGMARPSRCPTCTSPDPKRHPAMQLGGEVQLCRDPFHPALPDAKGWPPILRRAFGLERTRVPVVILFRITKVGSRRPDGTIGSHHTRVLRALCLDTELRFEEWLHDPLIGEDAWRTVDLAIETTNRLGWTLALAFAAANPALHSGPGPGRVTLDLGQIEGPNL